MYDEYFPKIYNYVFFKVLHRQSAEDIVSTVFLKVVENLDKFDEGKAPFNVWIFSIAHNALIDFYRIKKNTISIDNEDDPVEIPVDFEQQCDLIKDEERRILYGALTQTDIRTREIISLKYYGGFSIREIAAMLNINESTASTIHTRGISKLKKILGEEFILD